MAADGGRHIPVASLRASSHREEVIAALRTFYAEADEGIRGYGAVCHNRGQCCRFGQYGHRLYVTALEVCYYLSGEVPAVSFIGDVCPHAYDGKCHIRDRRPLGCRIFYCDPRAQGWQGPFSELLLARLRSMHEGLGVPYFYADWMTILRAIHRKVGQAE